MSEKHEWLYPTERQMPNLHNRYCLDVRRGQFSQAKLARSRISKWYEVWNDKTDTDILQRLNSPLNEQFISAVWELYVYAMLLSFGLHVTRLKQAPSGTTPDFLVALGDSHFYVEASAIYKEPSTAAKIWAQILDKLYSIKRTKVGFAIRPDNMADSTPKVNELRDKISDFLDSVDGPENLTLLDSPEKEIKSGDWVFTVNAWPHPQPDVDSKALLMSGMGGLGLVTDLQDLRSKLKTKSRHYKNLEYPLVFAILEQSFVPGTDNWHRMGALFGSEALRVPINPPGQAESFRRRDGFWDLERGNRKVSAILLIGRLDLYWEQVLLPSLWVNPLDESAFDAGPLRRLTVYQVSGDKVDETKGVAFWDGL